MRARIQAMSERFPLRVIAPLFGPAWLGRGRWTKGVGMHEVQNGLDVEHPRFFNLPRYFKSWDSVLLARGTRRCFHRAVRDFRPDVIDAHWGYPDGVAATTLANEAGLPCTVTIRGDDISLFLRTGRRRVIVRGLNRATAVIGVCRALVDEAIEAGVRPDHCHVVPNGVDSELFHPGNRDEARRALGLDPAAPLLLSVGHMSERKGFHLLVRALPLASSERASRAHLAIVGGTGLESDVGRRLSQETKRLGLQERVHLVGGVAQTELRRWYNAADLFCLASSREGMPNVILEAFACGLPVLAVPAGGVPETVPTDFGLLVEREPKALAVGIDEALARTWDHKAIAEHARGLSWQRTADGCLAVFREVLGR